MTNSITAPSIQISPPHQEESAHNAKNARSVTGATWKVRQVSDRAIAQCMQDYDLSEIVARIALGRGISYNTMPDYLTPTLRNTLPDPTHLIDMKKAAERICHALSTNETIAIFGDYDVDGATSTALLVRFFRMLGTEVLTHIPDRILEGYGPNAPAFEALRDKGATLCITVDCGIAAIEPIEKANAIGLDVIVLDHHMGSEILPPAHAIVNPNRLDETSQYGYLAGVGVAFLCAVATTSLLKEKQLITNTNAPNLLSLLDLVALGTVCDVVPLIGVNRTFVYQGLRIMQQRKNPGIAALMEVAAIEEAASAYHLGYVIGPRINAGGRVGKASLGADILSSTDLSYINNCATELNHYNSERKAIEQHVLDQATHEAEQMMHQSDTMQAVLCVAGDGWHPGVIGIVAGRIKDRHHLPSAIITFEGDIGKASMRSITGVDCGAAILAAKQKGLIQAGGGHAMAGGFTVLRQNYEALVVFFNTHLQRSVEKNYARTYTTDGFLQISGATVALLEEIEQLAPFGSNHPEPSFIFEHVRILRAEIRGGEHVAALLKDHQGNQPALWSIAFRSRQTPLGEFLLSQAGKGPISLLGKAKPNHFNGRTTAQIHIMDAAPYAH